MPTPGPASAAWQLQLLGGLQATRDDTVLARFPSRAVAMLCARLALYPRRRHAREELIELLWPGVDVAVGRNRLRQSLSTLRRLLERPVDAPGSVLAADRLSIGLQADAIACDVQRFEQHLRQGELAQALDAYRGDLLPGFYDEWVEDERLRLRALLDAAREAADARQPAHPLARESAPPLPTMAATHAAPVRSLPAFASLFFGRETDQRRVHDALATQRLVTLTGVGGCGKTRLAVEVARAAAGVATVAFVPLAECGEAGEICERIRAALRIRPSTEPAAAQLVVFLADRDVLLVLDNFEQLVEAGGRDVVLDLLGRLPHLRCLVTSRRILDVAGECTLALAPLPLPDTGMARADAARTPSLALFIDRARGARPDFALTEGNADALVRLALALEGLPLAIEIAASRVRAHSPEEMCAALARRFALLARQGARATRHGRHVTLESTIDWSWRLLAPARQRFLAALSVFRGGCTSASANAVCATLDAQQQLEALVSDSLLVADIEAPGGTRFSMLETVREFAQERLHDDRRAIRARHRAHALALAQQLAGSGGPRLDVELPNLLQAVASAVDDGEPDIALRIALALRPHWLSLIHI